MPFQKVGNIKDLQNISQQNKPKFEYAGSIENKTIGKDLKVLNTDSNYKSSTIGSFFKGWTKTYDDLASGVNKVLEEGADLLGLDKAKEFFEENRKYWNTQSNLNDIQTAEHKGVRLAGEIINPTLLAPAGIFSKGKLATDLVKSMSAGALLGGGGEALRTIGKDNLTDAEKTNRILAGATIGGLANGIFRGGIEVWKKIFDKAPYLEKELHDATYNKDTKKIDEILSHIKENPEAFGLKKSEAEKLAIIPYEKPIEPELIEEGDVIYAYPPNWHKLGNKLDNVIMLYPRPRPMLTRFPQNDRVIYAPPPSKEDKRVIYAHYNQFQYPMLPHKLSDEQNTNWLDIIPKADFETLKQHPNFNDLLERLGKISAKDKRYQWKVVTKGTLTRDGRYIYPTYEENPFFDYALSKASVKRILNGKPTEKDIEDLRHDLLLEEKRMQQQNNLNIDMNELDKKSSALYYLENKDYDNLEKVLNEINDDKFKTDIANELMAHNNEKADNIASQYLFANANHRLASGFAGGTINAIQNPDQNNDGYVTDEERMIAFLKGFGLGFVTPDALRLLGKLAPETYNKIRELATTEGVNNSTAGAFVGKGLHSKNPADDFKDLNEYLDYVKSKGWTDIDSDNLLSGFNRLFRDTRSAEYNEVYSKLKQKENEFNYKMENLFRLLDELPEEHKADLVDYIENVKGKDYSPQIKQLASIIQDNIKALQDELKNAGFSPDIIDKYNIHYLARLYKDKTGLGRLGHLIRIYSPKGERGKIETLTKEQFKEKIANGELNPDLFNKPLYEGGIEVTELPNGKIKVKRDWTPEEREQMKQIKDASLVIPLTLYRLHSMKLAKDFFDEVKNIDGAIINIKDYANKAEISLDEAKKILDKAGYTKLPKSKELGALSGQWVRKDVADDILHIKSLYFDDNRLIKAWNKYISEWKKAKTIYNPTAHFNNFVGNISLAWYAGMPLRDIPKYFKSALDDIKKVTELKDLEHKALTKSLSENEAERLKQLTNELKYYIEAKKIGLLDTSFIRDITDTSGIENNAELIGGKGIIGKAKQKATEWYQKEDDIAKLAMYKALRDRGFTPERAKELTTLFMPDYSKPLPKGIRVLRNTALAPFISWTYYVMPHLFKYTIKDLLIHAKQGDTREGLKKTIVSKQIRKLLGLYALMEIMQSLLTEGKLSPVADFTDEKPKETRFIRMGINANGDDITTLKIDRLIPLTQLNPASWIGQAKQLVSGIPLSAFTFINSGVKMYNGRPVTYENRPLPRQIYDIVKYGVESYVPIPALYTQIYDTTLDNPIKNLLYPHKKRGQQLYKDRTLPQNILKLLGINTITYDNKVWEKEKNKKRH